MSASDRSFFGHPRGLSTLFFTEMWERFSYYGMRGILILFMTSTVAQGGLGLPVDQAGSIYGTYVAMVYMTTLVGGWLADRLLGFRRSVFWGGVLIMCGHLSLAVPGLTTFYLGLVLVVLGTGLLKGNISAIVGQLYEGDDDTRRDAGYSLYYMGINLGGAIGPIAVGLFAQHPWFKGVLRSWGLPVESAWHFGFALAAVGMFFGLVQYVLGQKRLPAKSIPPAGGSDPVKVARAKRVVALSAGGTLVVLLALWGLTRAGTLTITPNGVGLAFDILILATVIGFFGWLFLSGSWTPAERKRLVVIFVLFLAASVFWAGFEQAGSTLTLFAQRNTRPSFLGMTFPASWFQSINSIFIIIFAPVFGWIWLRLGRHDPSRPTKFALGLFLSSLGYVAMFFAAKAAANGALVSPMWLVVCYLMQTFGELCLSPVGMSAMSSLAPARVGGLMFGVWFLASSVGNKIAGRVGGLYESFSLPTIFGANAGFVLVFAALMALLIVPIKRMLARPDSA
jgi:proton-dependent oligopeptide transporter, POT family